MGKCNSLKLQTPSETAFGVGFAAPVPSQAVLGAVLGSAFMVNRRTTYTNKHGGLNSHGLTHFPSTAPLSRVYVYKYIYIYLYIPIYHYISPKHGPKHGYIFPMKSPFPTV